MHKHKTERQRLELLTAIAAVLVFLIAGAVALFIARPDNQVYVGSGHPEWPPIMYRDGDIISGAGAELFARIAADLGLKVESRYAGNWDEVHARAKKGEVDLLVGAYKTRERETYLDYSIAYTVDPVVIYLKYGASFLYSNWGDLRGKKGVLTVGDSYGQQFDEYIDNNLDTVRVNTVGEAFDRVNDGRAYYFVYALYSGEKFLAQNGLSGEFEMVPKFAASEDFFMTVSKASSLTRYLPAINNRLEKYKSDGTIDSLIEKYRTGYLQKR